MKPLNAYTALQVTISIALISLLIVGFYAVATHTLDVATYKILLLSCAAITAVQISIEVLKEQNIITL